MKPALATFVLSALVTFARSVHGSTVPPVFRRDSNSSAPRYCGTQISPERAAKFEMDAQAFRMSDITYHAPEEKAATVVIPVYWNIYAVNKTTAGGWISNEQLADQMRVLNTNFLPAGIQFNLVSTSRTINPRYFNEISIEDLDLNFEMKKNRKGGAGTLNVWTVGLSKQGDVLAYAAYPADYSQWPGYDGIVLAYGTLPGSPRGPYNLGRTLTHEVGHWFGLYHVSEGESCNRKNPGDYVDDTPQQSEGVFGCPSHTRTCAGNVPLIPNYMDYLDDKCMQIFSNGQILRMKDQLKMYRKVA